MPQDNLRSAVHSSLKRSVHVVNEDSNETDQCRTDRKSKTTSTMVGPVVIERGIIRKEPHPSLRAKEEKKATAMPSFQLKQVSQGADKLNMMIDSWSRGIDLDGQSGHIARDLLRGALDLQESLIMLGKLQEASKMVAQAKRKQEVNIEEEEAGVREMGSNSFRNENHKKLLEKPRSSVDGSSTNYVNPWNSVDESSRNCIKPWNSVDGSARNDVYPWNSVDGSSRNCIKPRNSVDGSSRNDVYPWNSVDGSSRNCIKPRNSVDGSSRNDVYLWNSVDESSRNYVDPWNSVDGSSRNCIKPRNSFDGSSRNNVDPRNSIDGSSRNCIEQRNSVVGSSGNFIKPRHSVDGSSRNCIEQRNSVVGSSGNFIKPRHSVDGSSRNCIEQRNSVVGSSGNFVEPRNSVDGSCIEELRKVIRDSLYRQNLLSIPSDEQMVSSSRWQFDSLSDGPPASSSRLLTVSPNSGFKSSCSDQKVRSNGSISLSSPRKEVKTPNLIAKLMGLEDFSSQTAPPNKKPDTKMALYGRQPIFNIDMPKARKPQFKDQMLDPEHKTLKEVIEAMQFKGLLKSNHIEDLKLPSRLTGTSSQLKKHDSKDFHMETLDNELPPIVIIKPLRFSCLEEENSEPKQTLNTLVAKESKIKESADQNSKKIESVSLNYKQLKTDEIKAGKTEMRKPLSDRRKLSKESDRLISKENQKNIKTTDEPSKMIKASVSPNQKKKEVIKIPKKAKEVRNALSEQRKPVKENTKSVIESKTQVKTISTKPRQPENRLIPVKNHTSAQKAASQNCKTTSSAKPKSQNSNQTTKSRTKIAKPVRESTSTNSATENKRCKEDDKETDPTHEIDFDSTTTRTLPADQLPIQTGKEDSEIHIKDNTGSECKIIHGSIQRGGRIDSSKVADQIADNKNAISKTGRADLKQLLLSSRSFLNSAEELFDLHINPNMFFQTNGVEGVGMKSDRPLLDCANEFMTHKSRRVAHWSHPMAWVHMCGPKVDVTLDPLVDELVDGIENLRRCGKVGDRAVGTNGLYSMLGRDLRCKGLVGNGVWDLGWLKGFAVEDADQVVGEVEKHVLDVLIEEIVINLA
ncbi:uncharacterized protein LOC131223060 [Magnolia sinica]|uniref:uncharacterized protein LOC131223060 n=1 Tax=Magnolia sinica TaxID=86752 RepID=UPI002657EF21|nr:uncharacterized protein LOC131223060 [Magnolia sinica]